MATLGLRNVMLIAAVPGLLAVIAITVAARETRRTVSARGGRETLSFNLQALRSAGLYTTLAVITPFEIGNVATTLLILRATTLLTHNARSLASATSIAILLYACHNAAAMLGALLGLVQSFGDLGASLVAGLIWALVSPTAAFIYVAAWMLVASLTALWRRSP